MADKIITPEEKALLQAKHRQEAVEARNRQKERKKTAYKKVDSAGSNSGKRIPGSTVDGLGQSENGAGKTIKCRRHEKPLRYESISVPEGRTYSPPTKWAVYPFRWSGRALCEAVAAPAGALWTMPQSCELAVIVLAAGGRCYHL